MTIGNREELSVSELSRAIKTRLEQEFGRVQVRGEINSLARPNSGHLYFSLVDPMDNTRIKAACWRGSASRLTIRPEDGQEVIVTARLTAYGARSQYQLIVENIEFAGIGALLKMLEERRQKLAKEGLFDPQRKRPLPTLPGRIGVITSEKGAVWRDILHRIEARFPLPVLLSPVLVQGKAAASEIIAALKAMNVLPVEQRPDVVIIARGGGSMEDLLPFHDETLVRAVAASTIPVVSAIGHETDTTLIDHAADLRAPTPTAAAEMVVPVRRELQKAVAHLGLGVQQRLQNRLENLSLQIARFQQIFADPHRLLETPRQKLDMTTMRLECAIAQQRQQRQDRLESLASRLVSPKQILLQQRQQHEQLAARLRQATRQKLRLEQQKLSGLERLLKNTSLTRTLERGFALVLDDHGKLVTSTNTAKAHDTLTLRFADGELKVGKV